MRGASWQRLTYEIGLALFCGLGTAVVHLELTYDPPQDSMASAIGFAVLGFFASVALVPLRLVRPLSALMICGLLSVAMGGFSLTLVPLSASVGYRAWRSVPIVLAYLTVLVGCVGGIYRVTGFPLLTSFLLGLMEFSAFVLLPGAVAAMVAQRRLLVMTMHQRNLELHAERRLAVGQAQTRERNRIAAELHDSLGHRLTLISLYAGGLAQAPAVAGDAPAPERQQALGLLRDTSAQAMGELRQILRILHQDGADPEGGRSLAQVEDTVASARGTGTRVDLVRVGEARPLPLLAEHAAYRVVQEGITNALKHAGGAPIRVEVRYEDDALFVEVRNGPGRAYEGQSTGQGLAGLAERVRLAGGVLSSGPLISEPSAGGGFRVGAVLPYEGEVPEAAPEPEGDFPGELRRSTRRQQIGAVAVVTSIVLSLGSCVGSIVVPIPPDTVSQNEFDRFAVGAPESDVRDMTPRSSWWTEDDVGDGKVCEYYMASPSVEPRSAEAVEVHFVFCFRDGVLVEKRADDITE
ncbi:sensor histidine kinase [Kineosporia succinea]|uniref:histidine kinase n=1 Tax=Kineosporia succinea TaxID=84632 RepID=A0ABT9PEG9_9ACTN|nr:sensor histidine kinase [Kineosporia succinea]MDP9831118.1 signal transduction histidine kinase [Kineosporia succinea]